ncbi:alpha-amylase, partial [Streptomyces sp. SID89]|nr:alpha-amylase [Streptomyces sp. SID89]
MRRTTAWRLRRPWAALAAVAVLIGLLSALPGAGRTVNAAPAAAEAGNTATVFYYTKTRNWSQYYLHYAPDGAAWTQVPGTAMEAGCTDWVKKTVSLGTATTWQATFNNGSGTWDNNGGKNYALGTGTITVKDGVIAHSDPCGDDNGGSDPSPSPTPTPTSAPTSATVFYYAQTVGWSTVNLHYAPTGGSWTTVPGIGMEQACPGWFKKTVDLGGATGLAATFNNGNGTWDNNNGANYALPAGVSTVKDKTVTKNATDPCASHTPDTTAPTVPTAVKATATDMSIVLTWDPSTDDTGVTGYQVTRTGGTKGSQVTSVGSTVLSESGLEPNTKYTYTVKALDAAGNVSAASAAASATTGQAPPPAQQGAMLGGDPRKDPIYF